MNPITTSRTRRTLLAAGLALPWAAARAQAAKGAPLRIVVPAAPGGSTDILARRLAQLMQDQTGSPVIVDNKAGASGAIGAEAVARSAPDGQTLLMTVPDAITVVPHLRKEMPYKVEQDFLPVSLVAETSWLFAINAKLPAKTIQDLVKLASAQPGAIKFSSPGIGTSGHLIVELLAQKAGVQMLHVPYKGAAPAAQAVVGGEVDLIATSPIGVKNFIDAGQLRALVISGGTRSGVLPDVPTLNESGFPGLAATAWFGLLGPAGMPAATVDRLESSIRTAGQHPDFLTLLKQMGLESRYLAKAEFGQYIRDDSARWRDVIRGAKTPLTE